MSFAKTLIQLFLISTFCTYYGRAEDLKNIIGCTVADGACQSGIFIGEFISGSLDECQQSCQQDPNCNFYTYHSTEQNCLEFFECYNVTTSLCPGVCQSGSIECMCSEPGECQGELIGLYFLEHDACIARCESTQDCFWWNYDPTDSLCILLSNCISVEDQLCPDCLYGEKACYQQDVDVVLVTSGYSGDGYERSVEVIPLDSPQTTCPPVPDIPFADRYGHGFVHEEEPVVCSMGDEKKCYKFNTKAWLWQDYVELIEARSVEAGTFLGEDYILLGGYNSNTSEIFSAADEEFSYGPDLPYIAWLHCATTYNGNKVIMTGGYDLHDVNMNTTSMLDMIDGSWTYLPDFTTPRSYLSCGIATAADGTSSLVIAGGYYNNAGHLPDSQILELDSGAGSWRRGVDLPAGPISDAYSLPYKDSFLMVGGYSGVSHSDISSIWQYDPNNATMPWILRPEQLSVARSGLPVSILLKARDMNCTTNA